MTAVILILTIALILMVIFNVFTVRIFLKYIEVIPEKKVKETVEEQNDFGSDVYSDISEVTPEVGIKSLTRK